jgi:hypothetical protein
MSLTPPCPAQHSLYGLARKSTNCVITGLIHEVVGEIQLNRGKSLYARAPRKKTWGPTCLSFIRRIYFLVEEGHPLLRKHGTSRSRYACVQFCGYCAAAVVFFLTPVALWGQELQLAPLPIPRAYPASNSMIALAPQLDLAGPVKENAIPQQATPLPQESQEIRSGTSNDRIFWTMPNFLTVEDADRIPPLSAAQKFKVVARGVFDPFEFVLVGFVAGLGQASNSNPSYGQGAQGYAKRYGTSYADNAIENFMASAVFPSVLHQDPRYYQLGHGGFRKRTAHAVARVLITRSDSGRTQLNYSELMGGVSAAAISTYTYHPQSERSFGNVMSVWGTQMAWDAATYMIKEFWPDLRKKRKNSH